MDNNNMDIIKLRTHPTESKPALTRCIVMIMALLFSTSVFSTDKAPVKINPTKLIRPYGAYAGGKPLYENFQQYKGPIKSVTEYFSKMTKKDLDNDVKPNFVKREKSFFNDKQQVTRQAFFYSDTPSSNEYEYGNKNLPFVTLTKERRGETYKEIKGPKRDQYGNILVSQYGEKYSYYKVGDDYLIKYVQSGANFHFDTSFMIKNDRSIYKKNGKLSTITINKENDLFKSTKTKYYNKKNGKLTTEYNALYDKDKWIVFESYEPFKDVGKTDRRFNITITGFMFNLRYSDRDHYSNPQFRSRCDVSKCVLTRLVYEYY